MHVIASELERMDVATYNKRLTELALKAAGSDGKAVREKLQEIQFRLEAGETWDEIEESMAEAAA